MSNPKDFIYMKDMSDLADWRPEHALKHPSNVSNTRLLPRPPYRGVQNIPHLLICHDFKGGYHPCESSQGQCPFPETTYTAEYLSLASSFAYFSHHRVSIPPAAWINTLHRNGVKVLGTFLVEGPSGASELSRLFQRGSEGEYIFATQLAQIAATYGFDGWLLNFESSFPPGTFSPRRLQKFLTELRSATRELVDGAEIIWYDALTVLNQVHWQNSLTLLNVPFFDKCDGIFTNYGWRPHTLAQTVAMARVLGRVGDVYMGIDCFGRGSLGGGGFGVREPLYQISTLHTSAALFAPGWTFENFGGRGFHALDKRFWIGDGATPGVSYYAPTRECGSEEFFYTNFNRGFGETFCLGGSEILNKPWVHIGAQSILPTSHPSSLSLLKWSHDSKIAYNGGWSLSITLTAFPPRPSSLPSSSTSTPTWTVREVCPLYKLGLKTLGLAMRIVYSCPEGGCDGVGMYLNIQTPQGLRCLDFPMPVTRPPVNSWAVVTYPSIARGAASADSRLIEFGLYFVAPPTPPSSSSSPPPSSDAPITRPLLNLGAISFSLGGFGEKVQPSKVSAPVAHPTDDDDDDGGVRLSWKVYKTDFGEWRESRRATVAGTYSALTGDFAWFAVWKGGTFMGASHCLEYTVGGEVLAGVPGPWRVDGVTWDGDVWQGEREGAAV